MYFLRKDSHKQATRKELLKTLKGYKIDLLMIDGDHGDEGVKKYWQMYSALVKQNGIIVFHDILFHPKVKACKVNRLWNEIKRRYRYREFLDRKDDRGWGQKGGIGIIYYKDTRKRNRKCL